MAPGDLAAASGTESLAAAAAYLRAFAAADTTATRGLLGGCTAAELIAGLTVLGCVLADQLGADHHLPTTTVLERVWRVCAEQHRAAVGMA